MSHDLGVDFVNHPELAAAPQYAFASALWFWNTHNGNAVADTGISQPSPRWSTVAITGLAVRTQFYNNALRLLAS